MTADEILEAFPDLLDCRLGSKEVVAASLARGP